MMNADRRTAPERLPVAPLAPATRERLREMLDEIGVGRVDLPAATRRR